MWSQGHPPPLPQWIHPVLGIPQVISKSWLVYKPTTALPVSYKSSFITNRPWISEIFLRNIHCLTLSILLLSVKYPGLQEMTRYPHQWTARRERMLAMIGQSVIMRIPHSHSSPLLLKFHQLHCQKMQRLLKFLAAKVPLRGKKAEVPATLAKEILMDKLQLCDLWDVV